MSRTRIKICGLYREQHVDYVNAARPDYAGFVFYPPSHRYVDREMMKRLREKLSHKIPAGSSAGLWQHSVEGSEGRPGDRRRPGAF